jgi:NAD(P)-dependent dehydrogenase (short-subunit alcohol dehydrogenase family)
MATTNLLISTTVTKLALPWISESDGGRIINIGAGAAIKAGTGMGAYAASKSGVHRLTEALAEELAGSAVTMNALLPSIIDTPANRADMADKDFSR